MKKYNKINYEDQNWTNFIFQLINKKTKNK